jgi:hypothetical protein
MDWISSMVVAAEASMVKLAWLNADLPLAFPGLLRAFLIALFTASWDSTPGLAVMYKWPHVQSRGALSVKLDLDFVRGQLFAWHRRSRVTSSLSVRKSLAVQLYCGQLTRFGALGSICQVGPVRSCVAPSKAVREIPSTMMASVSGNDRWGDCSKVRPLVVPDEHLCSIVWAAKVRNVIPSIDGWFGKVSGSSSSKLMSADPLAPAPLVAFFPVGVKNFWTSHSLSRILSRAVGSFP